MLRILLVEDKEDIRKLIGEQLAGEFEILQATDPIEALAIAMKSGPDCILLDLELPRFSGLELCRTLCTISHTKSIPVFVMVSPSTFAAQESFTHLGAREVFQTPPDFTRLKNALRSIEGVTGVSNLEDVQVSLKVVLKLIGRAETGKTFELLTATDQVSVNGFQCRCSVPVESESVVEVYHVHSSGERRVGRARMLDSAWEGMPWQTCKFQFTEKTSPWIV